MGWVGAEREPPPIADVIKSAGDSREITAIPLGSPGRIGLNRSAVYASGFISVVSQPNRFAQVRDLWGGEL
jgi:hypothetical protein